LLVVAAFAVTPGAAWAADAKPAAPAKTAAPPAAAPQGTDDERAAKWLSEGNKAFKDGKFAEAEKAYQEAFALKRVYDIAGNLAMAEFAQSKHRDAAEHLALAIRLFPVTGEPATREQMQKTFDQCKGHVGTVKVEIATVRGAQVSVDGKVFGEAPLADDLFLDPGSHTISVTAKGYKDASKSVDVQKGVASVVKLDLVLLPPEVVVRNGPEQAPPPPPRSKKPAIALGAVAVVALGVGGALLGVGAGKKGDAGTLHDQIVGKQNACVPGAGNFDSRCGDLKSQLDSAYLLQNIGGVSMVVGGAAAIGAVTYLLWPAPRAKKEAPRALTVTPVTGREQTGLVVSGSF
jgi:tetratricopeptide (TPR) repeat protein